MIYVREHAAYAYIRRFEEGIDLASANEKVTLLALDAKKINHKRHSEVKALINGNVVMIGKEQGKDTIILTVENKVNNEKINWWEQQNMEEI